MQREPGFYWGRFVNEPTMTPMVCNWTGSCWLMPGSPTTFVYEYFVPIGDRITPPEEK